TKDTGNLIKSIKEQLRQVPGRGLGYGVLKYINREATLQSEGTDWDVVFNYLGQFDNVVSESKWLKGAGESTGASISELYEQSEKMSVSGFVQGGELGLNWSYSGLHYEAETIRQLAGNYLSNLEAIIAHCIAQEQQSGQVFTPSDYGLGAEITYAELDAFLQEPINGKQRKEQVDGIYRLSGLQQGMLFHALYDTEAGIYLDQFSCDLVNLDIHLFKLSWDTVLKKHSILRSAFYPDTFSIPVQCAYKEVEVPIKILDYRYLNGEEQAGALKEFAESDRISGFNFNVPPLMRLALIRLTDDRYRMLWTWHHVLLDGWSFPILKEEFLTTYELLSTGKETRSAEEDRYEDFIRYTERIDKEKEEIYWRNYMKGIDKGTLLPFIGKTVERTKGVGESKTMYLQLDEDATAKIQSYAQLHRITANTIMQGVWACLLNRYTGSNDIVFGTIVSGRPDDLPNVEQRVGMYINTMPLHTSIDKERPIIPWLQEMQQEQASSRQYQHTSYSKIQSWTGVQGDLFDSIFVFQNFPISKVISSHPWKLRVENSSMHAQNNLPLTITASIIEKISIEFRYNNGLLSENDVLEIRSHFGKALHQLVNNPAGKIGDIEMLTEDELQQLSVTFNVAQVAYPFDKSMVDLFEEQVALAPDNVAIVFENAQLSYRELNERANQLARYLQQKGVRKETLVPMCMERGIDMMVAILAILKAGGAYVPVDSDFPSERINYMLEDTGSQFLLSTKESRVKLNIPQTVEIIEMDGDWLSGNEYSPANLLLQVSPQNLAYVIYTSGSTGKPKGVMIEHRNLIDYVAGLKQKVQIHECRSFALVSTIATDLGNTVIYASLLSGGALHIFSKESVSDAELLHRYFRKYSIDCLKIVPSHWQALSMEDELLMPAKLLVFGGEALQAGVIETILTSGSNCKIVNHYGPTETTIGKLLHIIDHGKTYGYTVPIGKPFSNTQVYILDKDLKLCPVGVPGQLYISGDGIARGYYNNPELTKQKFLADPFKSDAASRMYSTGDLVKYLPGGNIEFIGRVDDQVKIRGYRVELGEIETVLQKSGLVKQAVVLAREDKQGNKRLVGYIVPEGSFEREELFVELREKLPEYMVPSLLVELESLPLTPNGKVDRKALPDPDAGGLSSGGYVAPRNNAEEKLSEIWQDILEVDQVGIHDDFFGLGGHSLLAVRLISAIRKAFAVEIAIGAIFDHPTVALLSAQLINPSNAAVLPAIGKTASRPERIPLSFSQERLWFIDQLGGSVQYHVPAVLRLTGNLNKEALAYALKTTVDRHEILRTVYREEDGLPYQFIKETDGWQLASIDGRSYLNDDSALQKCIRQLINKPYQLSEDYMLRATLIILAENDYVLVVTLHHIASDGWSKSILVNDFAAFYQACESGNSAGLKALPVQYADYAIWQRRYLEGEVLEGKLRYWRDKLQGVSALQLPTDFPRPPLQSTKGSIAAFNVEKTLAVQLQSLCQQQGTTLFMTLLAALKVLLYRHSGQNDICVGTPIAGRQQQELEGLIGFFVNTLALRTELNSDSSFTSLLQQVRTETLEAYEHQEVPFEKVVESVVKDRDMSRSPIFQVMFVLRNTPEVPELVMKDVNLARSNSQHATALFDMTFFITETENGLQGLVEYSTDLFTEATIRRIMNHYTELLRSIVQQPQQKIGALTIMGKVEEKQLLVDFNDTITPWPENNTVIELFKEQALKSPTTTAIVFEEEQLSYQQLNERSNQLAHYLQKNGLTEGMLVPVSIERGIEMIVSVLAILKAGGVYVPVDPEYPAERISYMLEDTGATMVVSSRESRLNLPTFSRGEIIEVDGVHRQLIGSQPATNLSVPVATDYLVYVIYTSGSTGRPKGVRMGGKGMVNLLTWQEKQFVNKRRRVLQFASLNFDVSFQEIFSTLCFGSSLYLIHGDRRRDMSELMKDITKYQLTHLFVPYIVLKNLVEYIVSLNFNRFSIEEIIVAGEQLKLTEDIQALLKQTGVRIINQYGPTEAHVVSSYSIENKGSLPALPPIGKPIDNTTLYILGNRGEPVPVGVPGELYIGGVQVAQGYLNLPELTKEKFLADTFTKEAGGMLYRTGDLARWLADGNIEYLGRKDDQIKIRGYRVELGEIEGVLQECGMVRQAVVLAKGDSTGSKRLVAYIVPEGIFDKSGIINCMKSQLPEYMVPALLIEMDSLPVTRNGKIDRRALPDPDGTQLLQNEYVAPRNEVEQALADIWQELLKIERVGIHDNFFELGGHSLLAIRVVHLFNGTMNFDLSVKNVFIHPTIAGLAAFIHNDNRATEESQVNIKHLIPVKTGSPNKVALYIVCGGGGSALRFRKFAKMLDEDQPVYSLQSPIDSKDIVDFPKTIEKIATMFIEEVLESNPNGPYALSGHCIGGIIAFEMAKQLEARGKKVHMLAMFDTLIRMKEKRRVANYKNLYNIPERIRKSILKTIFKIDFETFLLRKYTRTAIGYKVNSFNGLIKKMRKKWTKLEEAEYVGMEIFNESSTIYTNAARKYKIDHYDGELLLFYAKERYFFTDADNNIRYKKIFLNNTRKVIWENYVKSITIYDVDGDHSDMFEPVHGDNFARLLQQHLSRNSGEAGSNKTIRASRTERSLPELSLP
ncbi:MAG: linear pentadecapeptide gramicidin synthetase LgrD, partial [Ferruginibacter sp.]|nr:linear pentadecapeptide gramicidin synthetase LgrD [Ferruginibacter sp.]